MKLGAIQPKNTKPIQPKLQSFFLCHGPKPIEDGSGICTLLCWPGPGRAFQPILFIFIKHNFINYKPIKHFTTDGLTPSRPLPSPSWPCNPCSCRSFPSYNPSAQTGPWLQRSLGGSSCSHTPCRVWSLAWSLPRTHPSLDLKTFRAVQPSHEESLFFWICQGCPPRCEHAPLFWSLQGCPAQTGKVNSYQPRS